MEFICNISTLNYVVINVSIMYLLAIIYAYLIIVNSCYADFVTKRLAILLVA